MFSSHSSARITQLRYQLATFKKGSLSITYYFHKMKSFADTWAAINQPLNDYEVVSYLLVGLSAEYDSFVTYVTTHGLILWCSITFMVTYWIMNQVLEQHTSVVDFGFLSASIATKNTNNPRSGSLPPKFSNSNGRGAYNSFFQEEGGVVVGMVLLPTNFLL